MTDDSLGSDYNAVDLSFNGYVGAPEFAARLIRTKLRMPAPGWDAIARPRLLSRLQRNRSRVLTLVSAPAGTGKSTLITQWLDLDERPVAWYALDPSDNDLATFASYVLAAVQSIFPHACRALQRLLTAQRTLSAELLAAAMINDFSELPSDFVLVLDDYHLVHKPEIHLLVAKLLEQFPDHLHLVITARAEPPLPFSHLRAQGQLTEIRMKDLRFEPEETREFLERALERPVPSSIANLLEERTEGWAVGIRLTALSMQDSDNLVNSAAQLMETQRHVLDYLTDQVLALQNLEVQQFLLRTAVLERFCASLCEVLRDGAMLEGGAQETINFLDQAGIFLIPLDTNRTWYRFHGLFQELLRSRLAANLPPDKIADLHRRASRWFADQGLVDEAVQHALLAGDLDAAGALVEDNLADALNRLDRPRLERWLSILPPDLVDRRPGLLIARAWSYHFLQMDRSIPVQLKRAQALLDGETPQRRSHLEALMLPFEVQSAWLSLQGDRAIETGQRALVALPANHAFIRGLSMIYVAGGYQITGRQNEGLQLLRDAIRQYGPRFDAYSLRLWMSLMLTSQFTGSWEESSDAARHCLEMSRRSGMELGVAWGHYGMGVAAFEKGQSAVAKQHFHAIRELADSAHLRTVSDSMICSAIILEMEGELDRAGVVLDELSTMLIDGSSTDASDELMSCRARLALARGDASGALRLLSSVPPTLPARPLFQTEVPQITKVRALLARGGRENLLQARAHAQEVLRFTRRTFATRFEIEALIVLALCAEKEGARDEALRLMESAVLVAEPTGSVRIFADKGEAIAPLLRNVGGRGAAPAFVETLLAAIPSSPRMPPSAVDGTRIRMLEPLTNREMDVLELLAQRLSTKEIAEVLVVAPSTVQTHLANLFQKLDADNRRDAVVKARALGILT